jgi:CubicO group peptidase (beta-lactamase class C family)
MSRNLVFFALAVIFLPISLRQGQATQMQERYNVGGYIGAGVTVPYTFQPHQYPRKLPNALLDRRGNHDAAEMARAYLEAADFATGILLIDNGAIVFEGYKGLGNRYSEFYSMSIAKSLTSLAIGKALCNGRIRTLDMLVGDIVPEAMINSSGRSTIRQILMMSSGVWLTAHAGQPKFSGGLGVRGNGGAYNSGGWPIRLGQMTVADYLWGIGWEKAEQKNHAKPGEAFVYKSADTLTLSKVLDRVTGMSAAAYFDRHVWQDVRGERFAHWEQDKEGTTVANVGFQATLRDWGRIAIWIWEEIRKPGCFGDYLREATSTQIKNMRLGSGSGRTFNGYGYQWWTDNRLSPGFWGKGYAGQDFAINPKTGKILIKFSYRSPCDSGPCKPQPGIYAIFRKWNRHN